MRYGVSLLMCLAALGAVALYVLAVCTLLLARQTELLLLFTIPGATVCAWLAWHAFLRQLPIPCAAAMLLLILSLGIIVLALADVTEPEPIQLLQSLL
mgnify:CR=1 FL=1